MEKASAECNAKLNQCHVNNANETLQNLVVREFQPADAQQVQRIFYEGMMEMIIDTAFRGLKHHPESLLLYLCLTAICYLVTLCWWVIGPFLLLMLCARYICSWRIVHTYLDQAMSRDMGRIEEFYTKSSDSCLWVAVQKDKVVGVVALVKQEKSSGVFEVKRMSVDQSYRRCGVGMALGRKVLEFAFNQRYSMVVLGTTAYNPAAHRLYKRLGFQCVGVTNGYIAPGVRLTPLEWIFYRVSFHHYSLTVQNIMIAKS